MTRDALEILDQRYGKDDPEWETGVIEEALKGRVAQVVYALREDLGLTQSRFAKLVGIDRSNISKLENADYDGSALEMLWRICVALHMPLEISYPCPGDKSKCHMSITPAADRHEQAA